MNNNRFYTSKNRLIHHLKGNPFFSSMSLLIPDEIENITMSIANPICTSSSLVMET